MATTAEVAHQELVTAIDVNNGPGPWAEVPQERIDLFAEATGDHQFIHVDAERAAATPWGGTIAHGFLTLSMIPALIGVGGKDNPPSKTAPAMVVNYGLERVRFPSPVKVGSRVRATRILKSVELKDPNNIQLIYEVTVDIEGQTKPACVAHLVSRHVYHP